MPEYKELERSMLARMFRAGIIDVLTFTTRAEALGYSPDDVFLMIRLEKKEAAKVMLWEGTPEPVSMSLAGYGEIWTYSPKFDISGATYIRVFGYVPDRPYFMFQVGFEMFDAAGKSIGLIQKTMDSGGRVEDFSIEPVVGAVSGRVAILNKNNHDLPHSAASFPMSVEGVVI